MGKKTLDDLTPAECALLLYLEEQAVNCGGAIEGELLSNADLETAGRWENEGFIMFGKAAPRLDGRCPEITHWCKLSGEAFRLASELRSYRAAELDGRTPWRRNESLKFFGKYGKEIRRRMEGYPDIESIVDARRKRAQKVGKK